MPQLDTLIMTGEVVEAAPFMSPLERQLAEIDEELGNNDDKTLTPQNINDIIGNIPVVGITKKKDFGMGM